MDGPGELRGEHRQNSVRDPWGPLLRQLLRHKGARRQPAQGGAQGYPPVHKAPIPGNALSLPRRASVAQPARTERSAQPLGPARDTLLGQFRRRKRREPDVDATR